MFEIEGKVAIVTGGARGLGKQFALRLLSNGAKGVCITDINDEGLEETKKEFAERFGDSKVFSHRHNVADEAEWNVVWEATVDYFGGSPVDILVNNAGVPPSKGWKMCVDVNLSGVMIGSFLALEKMGAKNGSGGGGRIINVASVAGIVVGVHEGIYDAGYAASKQGVVAFTRSFSVCKTNKKKQIKIHGTLDGVKCYAICPWFTDTNMVTDEISVEDVKKKTKFRVLTVEEVGDCMIKALKWDKNGAIYGVFPDVPILEIPDSNLYCFAAMVALGKVVKLSSIQVEKLDVKHLIPLILLLLLVLYYLIILINYFLF